MKYILAFILFVYSCVGFAQTSVLYVNGASMISKEDAKKQAENIKNNLYNDGVARSIAFQNYPVIGSMSQSAAIITCQKIFSFQAFPFNYGYGPDPRNYEEYLTNLGRIYSRFDIYVSDCPGSALLVEPLFWGWQDLMREQSLDLKEKIKKLTNASQSLVIVGHSLGNFYIEAALGLLVKESGGSILKKVRVVNLGSLAASVLSSRLVNFTQDRILYGGATFSDPYQAKFAAAAMWNFTPQPTVTLCTGTCLRAATSQELMAAGSESFGTAHFLTPTFLNKNITYTANPGRPVSKIISSHVKISIRELSNLSVKEVAVSYNLALGLSKKAFDRVAAFFGIQSAYAQSASRIIINANSVFRLIVKGTGFNGREAIRIEGVACFLDSIKRGDDFFSQNCVAGNLSGEAFKVTVYDQEEDVHISVPQEYSTAQILSPVIAPTAPILLDIGSGTIRLIPNYNNSHLLISLTYIE